MGMKYCVILPSLKCCGPNNVASDIINGILDIDQCTNVDVFYFHESDDAHNIQLNENVRIKRISFFGYIDLGIYDVVHSHMLKADLYVFKNRLLKKNKQTLLVTTIHQKDYINLQYDYNSKTKAFVFSIIWRMILWKFNRIICLSQAMIDYYGRTLPKWKISYIYNGRQFDNKNSNISAIYYSNKKKLGTSCYLTKRKGLEQVLYALIELNNVDFYIAGDGDDRNYLKSLAIKLKIEDRVHFLGRIDNISDFLNSIDVYVLPSRGEGFPLSMIEAFAHKKACVVSNLDVVVETFSKEEIAIFELDNINDLVNKINYAFLNKEHLGDILYKRYINNFSSKQMVDSYLKIFSR
ncbi:glycosyltransferase family 4 protein [Photobacterium carnosum]|uniref:glycosyltransferase family 4 protein n=1 Tax=Photobacterium carnosum TaxID=2023717 RepID=UPI001E348063|nr:glycosyltransferase family 4 protein [Photobacterium carnosum]MCD9529099.1 glycosyltransferase [Photobacterium carnosum]